jgi:hypothetical protein
MPSESRPRVWNAALDAILKSGAASGPSRLQRAIQRIKQMEPHLSVKRILKRTAELHLTSWKNPWSSEEKAFVLDHAREFSAPEIARRLGRTPLAVYLALCRNGESAKFQDGYTQGELAQVLHVSPRKVRRWVRLRWLTLYQGRVKDRSLQRFFEGHSDEIDVRRLENDLRLWLRDLGLRERVGPSARWLGARQQSLKVHVCERCGRKIHGNAFWRHFKACVQKAALAPAKVSGPERS